MESRVERLSQSLKKNTAFLVTSDVNRFYFSSFKSSAGAVFITKDKSYLLVDFRYGEAAQKSVKNCEVVIFNSFMESIKELCKKHEISKIYLESQGIILSDANRYEAAFNEFNVQTGTDKTLDRLINNMRIIKSSGEINRIREAQIITEKAFANILNFIKPGVKEKDIALQLEFDMRRSGASSVSFDLITITGKKTSLPHGEPDDTAVQNGDFVTMDIGAIFDGYHSDMTRTVAVGNITEEQERIYNIVLEAQVKGIKAVKSGVSAGSVDRSARNVIECAGLGRYFGHSTGHGVGLDIHEEPHVSPKSETILSSGMVITIEPGIYLPNKFGVRIEDMVCVTKNGCNNLTSSPKKLIKL